MHEVLLSPKSLVNSPGNNSMEKYFKDSTSGPSRIPSADISRKVGNAWNIPHINDVYHASTDASLFSSSLPVLPHKKLNLIGTGQSSLSVDDDFPPLIYFLEMKMSFLLA